MSFIRSLKLALIVLVAVDGLASAQGIQPEAASGAVLRATVHTQKFMAVTANRYATDAAVTMMKNGGNAVDAVLAAQWTLTLVEPQSSGIGGGAFLLHWQADAKKVTSWDGRETARRVNGENGGTNSPGATIAASENFFRRADGSAAGFADMIATGRAVGAPGVVPMLKQVHQAHGKLPWANTFDYAIALAENGFEVSPRLNKLLADDTFLRKDPASFALYYNADGSPKAVGERLKNPALAKTLRAIAAGGSAAMQTGEIAQSIVTSMLARGAKADEILSLADLADYQPKQREPVCAPYRTWRICSMGPPSSGGITVLQILGQLEQSSASMTDPMSSAAAHAFVESSRLAFADRGRYLADPDFIRIPQAEMLDATYFSQRAKLINPDRTMPNAPPGDLPQKLALADDDALEIPATTHLSIVDADGNAVAMTSSVESAFGSRIGVGGFMLNNQLTDFSWSFEKDGKPVANRMEPGKRPLSSMAPTFVFDANGKLYAVIGSAGGPRIINYVARALVGLLDGKLDASAAVALPHVGPRPGATDVERGTAAEAMTAELEKRGHVISKSEMTSGTHLIVRETVAGKSGWAGGVDPRREGVAAGE